jgi:DNA end-binding protein Ku
LWSGTVSFGLVSIPVSLYSAIRSSAGVSLRMLGPDGAPLRREYVCPKHERALERDELVRAYELESGELVVLTDEELEALAPEASHDIEIQRFVALTELSPLLFERPYFLLPSTGATKPYRLLARVLEEDRRAGLASFVMRGQQHVVAILAEDGLLRAQTLRFVTELRSPARIDQAPAEVDEREVERLRAVIRDHAEAEVDRRELEDDSRARIYALAEQKLAEGRDLIERPTDAEDEGGEAEIIDLIRVIERSLERPSPPPPA